ncbi:MAG: DUF4129 domain-containing protein [Actinomycetota bacterium]
MGATMIVVALAAVGVWAALAARRRLSRSARPHAGARDPCEPLGPVARAFAQLERALAHTGRRRREMETARELMARTADLGEVSSARALEAFERERYGDECPSVAESDDAVTELERLATRAASPGHAGGALVRRPT